MRMSEPWSMIAIMTPSDILAFERNNPTHTPAKAGRIRRHLGISEVRYYMLLTRAARSTEGMTVHPVTARMVRERESRRARARHERTAA